MVKLRVHELAKKLNMSNHDVLAKLQASGIVVRTHSSSVDEEAAYKALGLSSGNKDNDSGSNRPRTVLRRRRERPEKKAESVSSETAAIEVKDIHKKPEEKISQAEASQIKSKSMQETPVLASKGESEKLKDQEKETDVSMAVKRPSMEQAPQESKPEQEASEQAKESVPSNVVRVIDADAIKARLASEGRSFGRRGPGGPRGGGPGRPGPRTGGPDRGAPSSFDSPPMMAPESNDSNQKAGARPSKKKKGSSVSYSREMRDSSSGGRELWQSSHKKKKGGGKARVNQPPVGQTAAHKRVVEMGDAISVNDLAHGISVKAGQVITKLMSMGTMVTLNEVIDFDTASIVAGEFGFEVKKIGFEETDLIKEVEDTPESLVARAPIITVMGHVDHGKTSVLDALRETSVVSGEAGGITQHIGAYSVKTDHGAVTFLDTPGHEAFTSMRARGAGITDIVVLVVAADDGVMPQTREGIDHAKAANVPVVVAINKMDLPEAKPERIMQQLSELGLQPEEWGGDTQFFKISALKRTGLDELLSGLAVLTEVLELRANPNKPAVGCVIEAKLDKGRGPVATVLTQAGTLKQGDYLVAGECMGRVRAMYDSTGKQVSEAGPSMPVQVLGLSAVPTAGDAVNAVADDKTAKTVSGHRMQKNREKELLKTKNFSLENFLAQSPSEEAKQLRLIIKADVYGSAEALSASLQNLSTKEVKVEIIHCGVGTITETNVNLAMASQAIIIGFNIKADGKAQALASQEKIDVRYYSVIYEAIDEVRKAMAGLLAPVVEERYLGKAEVRMVIPVSKHGKIAGSYVLDGKIIRSAKIRLKRKGEEVFMGGIAGLKRFKDDVKEVSAGYECGIVLDGFGDFEEGDILECFELKEVEAKLSDAISSQENAKNKNESMASA